MTIDFYPATRYVEPLFGISPDGIESDAIAIHTVKRNQLLFEKGENSKGVFTIISGQAILTVPETGKIVEILDSGAFFGEEALFQVGRIFMARVTIGGKFAVLDPDKVTAKDELIKKAMFHLYERQERLVEDISCLKSMPPLQRLAKLILTIPQVSKGESKVKLPWRKHMMAERIGVRTETFSRLIPSLRDHGAEMDGEWLVIFNLSALHHFVTNRPDQWRLRKSSPKRALC